MDERELRIKIKRNIQWCVQLAEDIVKERRLSDTEFAVLDTEFMDLVKLIQEELHFSLNNLGNQERHKELLTLLQNKISQKTAEDKEHNETN